MSQIIKSARMNAFLGPLGILASMAGMIVVVRSMEPALYAEYVTLLAFIGWLLLFTEAGGNIGFMRYLKEAELTQSRGNLYLSILRRRWLTGMAFIVILQLAGPIWARWAGTSYAIWNSGIFLVISLIVFANLNGQLAYYGLLGTFHHGEALLSSQLVIIIRSSAVAIVAVSRPTLPAIAATLLAIAAMEAVWYHIRLWRFFKHERKPLRANMAPDSYRHGLVTIFDKITTAIGNGPFLLLILAPFYGRQELALLAIAADTIQKSLSVTGLPMQNMILPYLNNALEKQESFIAAAHKVIKLSSLLFFTALGALFIFIPSGMPLLFGSVYEDAVILALVILFPGYCESWVRFVMVSALITKGKYKQIIILNTVQALLVCIVLAATCRYGLVIILAAQGTVKLLTSSAVVWLAYREQLFSFDLIPPGLIKSIAAASVFGILANYFIHSFSYWYAIAPIAIYLSILLLGLRLWLRADDEVYELLFKFFGRSSPALRVVLGRGHIMNRNTL